VSDSAEAQPIAELASNFIQTDLANAAAGAAADSGRANKRQRQESAPLLPLVFIPTPDPANLLVRVADAPKGVMEPKIHVYRTVPLFVSSIIVLVLLIGILVVGIPQLLKSVPVSSASPDPTLLVVAGSPSGGLAVASGSPGPTTSQPGIISSVPPTTLGPSPSASLSATPPVASVVPVPTNTVAPPTSTPNPSAPVTPAPTKTVPPPTSTPKPTATPNPTPKVTPVPSKPPVVVFVVTPKAAAGDCKKGLASFSLLLDNTGSNVPVSWSVNFSASDYAGDWGAAKPASGVVPAGESASVTITPQDLCPVSTKITDYFLKVLYGGGSPVTVTFTVTP
jgi:hypothetical protein